MTRKFVLLATLAAVGVGISGTAQAQGAASAQQANMTFFVTSAGKGNGADLGGLEGADAHCAALAKAAGAKATNWRAYLSTALPGGDAGVNARDVRDGAERRVLHCDPPHAAKQFAKACLELIPAGICGRAF